MNPLLTPVLAGGTALLVATAAVAQSPQSAADPFQPVVHVEYGRAVLVQRGSRGELLLPETERGVAGIAYLLVGAGGRASVTWRGQSSLLLHGPAEIEWAPGDESSGGQPIWSVLRLGEIDMEVRRGAPELKLPGGWHTRLGEGAFYVSGNGRDACDFEVRAGDQVALRPELRGGRVRPPVAIAQGMHVRLSDRNIAVSRPDATADAGPWGDRVEWPWRTRAPYPETLQQPDSRESVAVEPGVPSVTLLEPLVRPLPRPAPRKIALEVHPGVPFFEEPGPSASRPPAPRSADTPPPTSSPIDFRSRPAPEVTIEAVEVEPLAQAPVRTAVQSPVQPTVQAPVQPLGKPLGKPLVPPTVKPSVQPTLEPTATPSAPEPVVVQAPAPQPKPEPKPAPVARNKPSAPTFAAAQWRGVAFADLELVGEAAIESSPAVRATRIGTDRWRISLAARAEGPVWFFGKDEDVELQPGASVTIGDDGFVQSKQGLTRSVDAPQGRPAFAVFQ